MSGPLNRSFCTCLLSIMLLCSAVPSVLAADPNNGYPLAIVPLPLGLLACDSAEDVEAAFRTWKLSFERAMPERLPENCLRVAAGHFAKIEFLRRFENDHWTADLLKYFVFRNEARELSLLVGVFYGYGTARMKDGTLVALPNPEHL